MVNTLTALVDKTDNFEVVRDQIGHLLNENQAAQVALATSAGEPDPDLWKLRVYLERGDAFEAFMGEPGKPLAQQDLSPIVNVWFEGGTFDQSSSDVVRRQTHVGVFNADVYALGIARDNGQGGHVPGDLSAALNLARGVRLVRNFLMASGNTYLQLREKGGPPNGPGVGGRWIDSINMFQIEGMAELSLNLIGARISLRVTFNEFSPQADESNLLETVVVDIRRASDGLLLTELQYDL
jgi:hypothetical protein